MPTHQKHNPNGVRETGQRRRTSKATDRSPVALAQQPDPLVLQRAVENPGTASPDAILALQGAAGNRAVSNLLQAKLVVGPAGDRYEKEADRVAEQVMAMPTPLAERGGRGAREQGEAAQAPSPLQRQAEEEEELQMKPLANTITPLVQRQAIPEEEELLQGKRETGAVQRQELEEEELLQGKREPGAVQRQALEEEELLQGKREPGAVQRQALEEEELLQGKRETGAVQRQTLEEEELLQGKSEIRNPAGGFAVGDDVKSRLTDLKGNGSPLPDELRADMEARFGVGFGAVRVHADGEAGKLNRDLHARAFTHGSDIYFGPGRYDPDSSAGKRLLAHELTHVVQQTGGQAQHQTEHRSHGANGAFAMHTQSQGAVLQRARIGASREEKDEEIAKHFGKETRWESMPDLIKESYRQRYQEETGGTPPTWEEEQRKRRIKERQEELEEVGGMEMVTEGIANREGNIPKAPPLPTRPLLKRGLTEEQEQAWLEKQREERQKELAQVGSRQVVTKRTTSRWDRFKKGASQFFSKLGGKKESKTPTPSEKVESEPLTPGEKVESKKTKSPGAWETFKSGWGLAGQNLKWGLTSAFLPPGVSLAMARRSAFQQRQGTSLTPGPQLTRPGLRPRHKVSPEPRLSHKTSAGKVAANVYTERDNQCQLEVTFVPQITVTTSA